MIPVHFIEYPLQHSGNHAYRRYLFADEALHIICNGELSHKNDRTAGAQRKVRSYCGRMEQLSDELISLTFLVSVHSTDGLYKIQHAAVGVYNALGFPGRSACMNMARGLVVSQLSFDGRVRLALDHIIQRGAAASVFKNKELETAAVVLYELLSPLRLFDFHEGIAYLIHVKQAFNFSGSKAPVDFYRYYAELVHCKFGNEILRAVP